MAIDPQKGIECSNLAPRSWWLDYPDCYVLLDIHSSKLVNAAALLGNPCKKNKTNRKLVLSSGGVHALLGTLMVVDSASATFSNLVQRPSHSRARRQPTARRTL